MTPGPQEVQYREPKPELLSSIAQESRATMARWKIQNGPDTFLVHRHTGADGGPRDRPIPGVEYPGKWGEQTDDKYRFKRRQGPAKYFQNAGDRDVGGETAELGLSPPGGLEASGSGCADTGVDRHRRRPRGDAPRRGLAAACDGLAHEGGLPEACGTRREPPGSFPAPEGPDHLLQVAGRRGGDEHGEPTGRGTNGWTREGEGGEASPFVAFRRRGGLCRRSCVDRDASGPKQNPLAGVAAAGV